jgi:hypothetical protein
MLNLAKSGMTGGEEFMMILKNSVASSVFNRQKMPDLCGDAVAYGLYLLAGGFFSRIFQLHTANKIIWRDGGKIGLMSLHFYLGFSQNLFTTL